MLWFDAAACWPWRFCHSWLLLLESPFQWTLTVLALLSLGVLALRFYKDWCGAAHSVRPPGLFFPWRLCAHTIIDHWVGWLKDPHPHWYWLLWQQSLWQGHEKTIKARIFFLQAWPLGGYQLGPWEAHLLFERDRVPEKAKHTRQNFNWESDDWKVRWNHIFYQTSQGRFCAKDAGLQWEMGSKEIGVKWDECLFRAFVFGMSRYFGLVSQ